MRRNFGLPALQQREQYTYPLVRGFIVSTAFASACLILICIFEIARSVVTWP